MHLFILLEAEAFKLAVIESWFAGPEMFIMCLIIIFSQMKKLRPKEVK